MLWLLVIIISTIKMKELKNCTLLMKPFEVGRLARPLWYSATPLFEIKAYSSNMENPLPTILSNPKVNYSPRLKDYDRMLIVGASEKGNARRSVFTNNVRDDLLHTISEKGSPNTIYFIHLFQITQMVPHEELVSHLTQTLSRASPSPIPPNRTSPSVLNSKKKHQVDLSDVPQFCSQVLFPFQAELWAQALVQAFPSSSTKGMNRYSLQQSYFYLQVSNLYMIRFARNPYWMYLDLKEFDAYLFKFNFIRFFHTFSRNNEFIACKYSERLVKSIKWRSKQSEDYLLLLLRSTTWQRFILHVQDFCRCYELLHQPSTNETNPQ